METLYIGNLQSETVLEDMVLVTSTSIYPVRNCLNAIYMMKKEGSTTQCGTNSEFISLHSEPYKI